MAGTITRDEEFADALAALSVRAWLDAHGGAFLSLSGALVDRAIDRSGTTSGGVAAGGDRPYFDPAAFGGRGGIVFTGAHNLTTPAFYCGASVSGSVVWSPTATSQAAFEFGPLNSHVLCFVESGHYRVRAPGAGDAAIPFVGGAVRMTWRTSPSQRTRVLFNGAETLAAGMSSAIGRMASLRVGSLDGGVYPLNGAIGELVFASSEWTDEQMESIDAFMAERWT